jgi:phosphoenolpyruvate carboxykinase (GTP)
VTPAFEDIEWDGIAFTKEQYAQITSIDKTAWQAELKLHDELFDKLKHHLPVELEQTKAMLEKRLAA